MTYIDIETNEFPLYIGDLVLRTGLPKEQAAAHPRYQVVESPVSPLLADDERLVVHAPVFDGVRWYQNLTTRPATEEEKRQRLEELQQLLPTNTAELNNAGAAPDVVG
jgi:hypothetical protein